MEWSEIVLTLGLSLIFGLPTLGFSLYWAAEFLELRVNRRKQALSEAEAEGLRARLATLEERLAGLEAGESRVAQLEQEVEFLQRLLEQPAGARPLPLPREPDGREPPA